MSARKSGPPVGDVFVRDPKPTLHVLEDVGYVSVRVRPTVVIAESDEGAVEVERAWYAGGALDAEELAKIDRGLIEEALGRAARQRKVARQMASSYRAAGRDDEAEVVEESASCAPWPTLMACGHSSTAVDVETGSPWCPVCDEGRPMEPIPRIHGRTARCHVRGCQRDVPSSTGLFLFKYRPGEDFDTYYCGCKGWD